MNIPKIVILVDTATGWGRRMVRGVLDYAVQSGPWNINIEPRGQDETFHVPRDREISGIIARVSSERMAAELKDLNIPVVNISGLAVEGADFPRVTTDWQAAARLAEAHFRDRALSNFAYVGPVQLPYVHRHEQAFTDVLSESGTSCPVFRTELTHERRVLQEQALTQWLQELPKPVGIYTWAFQIGRDVINACRSSGIGVPHDVAVLGGDYDSLLSDASYPALSGIITPAREVGSCAAKILDAMMRGQTAPKEPVLFKPEEIESRLSTEILAIDDPQTRQAIAYLRAHACEAILVDDILKAVPMSRRSLERRFVKSIGRTPAQEMRRLRIDHARRLLAETNLTMQEIAEACGYASYNYLGNVFKKETGISPGRYRTQSRNR